MRSDVRFQACRGHALLHSLRILMVSAYGWICSALHIQPQAMGKVLAIVNRAISTYLINKAGFKVLEAHTGAVTLIQRFGSALNLNPHFHVLFIDGVFSPKSNGELRFHRVNAPTSKDNRKSQAFFCCVSCGFEDNADSNAAKNIHAAGHAVLACGGDVRPTKCSCAKSAAPMKQEASGPPRLK